jgi:hypothetical protein
MLFTLLPWGLAADRWDERWVTAAGLTVAAAVGEVNRRRRDPEPQPDGDLVAAGPPPR